MSSKIEYTLHMDLDLHNCVFSLFEVSFQVHECVATPQKRLFTLSILIITILETISDIKC